MYNSNSVFIPGKSRPNATQAAHVYERFRLIKIAKRCEVLATKRGFAIRKRSLPRRTTSLRSSIADPEYRMRRKRNLPPPPEQSRWRKGQRRWNGMPPPRQPPPPSPPPSAQRHFRAVEITGEMLSRRSAAPDFAAYTLPPTIRSPPFILVAFSRNSAGIELFSGCCVFSASLFT